MKLLHQGQYRLRLVLSQNVDYPPHIHNALELVLLTRGSATGLCDGKQVDLEPGDLFIAFPGHVHGYENSQNVTAFVLIAPMVPYLEPFRTQLEHRLPTAPVLKKQQWEGSSLDTLLQMALCDKDHPDGKVLQGYIMTLVGKLLPLLDLEQRKPGDTDGLRELLTFINHRFREPLSRKDIAEAVGYNESYISHLFSDNLHTTLTEYITALRLEEARRLLRDTDQTVSQIAVSLGFGSIRSFNRVFLRQQGCTPTAYRK